MHICYPSTSSGLRDFFWHIQSHYSESCVVLCLPSLSGFGCPGVPAAQQQAGEQLLDALFAKLKQVSCVFHNATKCTWSWAG